MCVVSMYYLCKWQSRYLYIVLGGYLRIWFLPHISLWQISQIQACLRVVVGPGLVSTSSAFMRGSHPASAWTGGVDTICTAVCKTTVTALRRVCCVVWCLNNIVYHNIYNKFFCRGCFSLTMDVFCSRRLATHCV